MKLNQWLRDQDYTQTEFAAMIGVSPAFISLMCAGVKRPGIDPLAKIERATDGAVTVADFAR